MSKKTPEEIESEIQKLRAIKPRVKPVTYFGDDNHAAIEAAIEALEKGYEDKEIDDKQDGEEWSDSEASCARGAYYWRAGQEDDAPSDGWPLQPA